MKVITLRYGKEKVQGKETFFSTVSILKSAINNVSSQQGLSVDEMSKRLKFMDMLNKHPEMDVDEKEYKDELLLRTKELNLENADFDKLKDLFGEVKWMILAKFIVELDTELKEAKEVQSEVAPAA
jgi:hypothetical protein